MGGRSALLATHGAREYRRSIQEAAENARSREKTGLKAHEGDEDLIDYYYLVMHPNTQHGLDLDALTVNASRVEACPKLGAIPGFVPVRHLLSFTH